MRTEPEPTIATSSTAGITPLKSASSACSRISSFTLCLAVVSLAALPVTAPALGFRIPNQDAEAIARGNAFVATADNPSAIYYNPAGITQIQGTEAQYGLHSISVDSHYSSLAPGGLHRDTSTDMQPVPQFYAVMSPKDRPYSLGLGVYAPFGLGLEWPEDTGFRKEAIEGRLMYVTLSPILAWKLTRTLSIAAGPTVNYSSLMLRNGLLSETPGSDEFHFRGDGFAYGAKAGIFWHPVEKWAFGFSYFSPTTVRYQGNSDFRPVAPAAKGTSIDVPFPQFLMAGISFRPSEKWNLEIGVDWTDWDRLNTVTFKSTNLGNVPFVLNWHSSYLAHFGVSRYLDDGWWIAAGYFFSENSTSDTSFSPSVPDEDMHVASAGFGRKGLHWCWALSGQVITGPPRHIDNGSDASGNYQFFNESVNFSVAYRF